MEVVDKVKDWFKERRKKYDIDIAMERVALATVNVEPGSEEWRRLRMDYEQELKNRRLVQEMAHAGVPWIHIVAVAAVLTIAGMAFLLDMDSPKALKFADRLISLIKTVLTRHF